MKKFVFVDANGQPVYTAVPSDDSMYVEGQELGDHVCHEIDYATPDHEIYLQRYWSNGWQTRPARPGENYLWDQLTVAWVPDYDRVRAELSRQLEQERSRRNQYAIEVNAAMFDGNNTAQTNLKNKIEEVRSRIELGIAMPAELLVWRDANNQTHSWPDINSYYQFLQTYAIALADRGTRLYIKMWQHKAAIQALIDANTAVEQVQAYPVDQGWD